IHVAMKQRDGERLDVVPQQVGDLLTSDLVIHRAHDGAIGSQALGDLTDELEGYQPCRFLPTHIVGENPGDIGAPNLQHVAEALADQETHAAPFAFHHRVRRDGAAVEDALYLSRIAAALGESFLDTRDEPQGRISRRRGDLREAQLLRVGIKQHDVGERAADVDSYAIAGRVRHTPSYWPCGCGKWATLTSELDVAGSRR